MGFEDRAQGSLDWARTPGHDAYWTYRDAFFDLVPALVLVPMFLMWRAIRAR